MYLDVVTHSPFWYWYYSGAALGGFLIAVVIGAMVLGLSNWKVGGIFFKTLLMGATAIAAPLGLASMGLGIAISNAHIASILSMTGVGVSLTFGIPYLIARALSSTDKGQSQQSAADIGASAAQASKSQTQRFGKADDNNVVRQPNTIGFNSVVSQPNLGGLAFRSGPRAGETVAIESSTVTLGRSPDNGIVIDDPSVSRKHARLTSEGGNYYIEDLGSMNGTKMNGKPVKRELVSPGATLTFGGVEIAVDDRGRMSAEPRSINMDSPLETPNATVVRSPKSNSGWLAIDSGSGTADVYRIRPGNNIIGRGTECDLSVDDPYISHKHALLSVKDGRTLITDLGSSGGVKVNDRPVTGFSVAPGTEIAVGETNLRLLEIESPGNAGAAVQDPSKTLVFEGPSKAVTALVVSGPDAGKSFKLTEGANIIGRAADCGVQLTDETVSRNHAQILYGDGSLSVSDLGSRSGTKVGDTVLTGAQLSSGDVVSMGQTRFTLTGAAA